MAQKTLKLKGVTAVGFFVGDYYLRPENMRLQKKYTICLEFHVLSILVFRVLEARRYCYHHHPP